MRVISASFSPISTDMFPLIHTIATFLPPTSMPRRLASENTIAFDLPSLHFEERPRCYQELVDDFNLNASSPVNIFQYNKD